MDNSALWAFFAFLRESAPAEAIRCRRRISLAGFVSSGRKGEWGWNLPRMLSVGIDIGTSTSQVIFSRLTVENTAGYFRFPLSRLSERKWFIKVRSTARR